MPLGQPRRLQVTLTILFHSSCAILSTLVSKAALNNLDAPVLLLALQFGVQIILLTAVGVPLGWIKPFKSFTTWRSLLPLAVARVVGILAKTYCLAAVDAAFYQVARGLLLPFTLLLSLLVLHPRPYFPLASLLGVGAVMLGFIFGLNNDISSHLTGIMGIALGISSSFTTAVESVVVKKYLNTERQAETENEATDEKEELGVWQTVWMSNIISLVVFFIPLLVLTRDGASLWSWSTGYSVINPSSFLPLAFAAGFVGFLLTIATFLQIKVTSPTTHMIVTASRGVVQSALAVAVFGEAVTSGRIGSMVMILGGSAVYGWAKDKYVRRAPSSDVELQTGYDQMQEKLKEKKETPVE